MSACGRSLRAQLWPVRGVSLAWRLSPSYESVPRCEQRVLCPSANPTVGRRFLWKSQGEYVRRKSLIRVRESGYDARPGWCSRPAHSHATGRAEELRRAITALERLEQRYELLRSRAAGVDGSGRAKGCLGAHDALLAGLACAIGNSKDGDSALPRWWKCLTPIYPMRKRPTSHVCCGRRSESRFDAEV